MTLHFQLSLQCNVLPITGFVRHTGCMPNETRDGRNVIMTSTKSYQSLDEQCLKHTLIYTIITTCTVYIYSAYHN